MTNPKENFRSVSDTNEKLYVNSYYRLLQCKNNNLTERKCLIRDLIRQSNFHCTNSDMLSNCARTFKAQLLIAYSDIVDKEEYPGLLSVVPQKPCNTNVGTQEEKVKRPEYLKKNLLQQFHKYLISLKSDNSTQNSATPVQPEYPNARNFNSHSSYSACQLTATPNYVETVSPNSYATSCLPKQPSHCVLEQCKLPDTKFPVLCSSGISRKRQGTRNDNVKTNKVVCARKGSQATDVQSNKKVSTNIGSSFVSASSMYRNPLKEAQKPANTNEHKVQNNNADHDGEHKNHPSLKNFDKKIVDVILNEIMDFSPNIKWSDIAGLDFVKTTVQEIVIWPLLRPDIFTGLRAPPRGILLFGPPGTGKTLIGKCIATESNSTFFCISASSLASKWVGESEQLVRALFAVAHLNQPAVIFIDEIDSLLSQRSDKDQDFTRKLKTEFLVQFDGAKTNAEERVLVVGATNRPHELDEAARRRFVKRLFVPLPEESARCQIIQKLLSAHQHELSEEGFRTICNETKGYSGSDVAHLCKEAAMGPIRSIGPDNIKTVSLDQVRPINLNDFIDALKQVRASVVQEDLEYYKEWNKKFGSFANT